MTDLEKLDYLIARAEISEAVSRYPTTIDTRDWTGFRAIFTDDIDILLTMAARADRPRQTVNADIFTEAVGKVITSFSITQHFLTDYRIEVKGDSATCLSYMYARHMPPADRPRQTVNADIFTEAVQKVITSFSITQHFLTDYKIEVKGDAATCLSYMYARHMPPADRPSQAIWDVGGFYEFHLRRTPAGWKVPKYTLILTWETGRPHDLAIDL